MLASKAGCTVQLISGIENGKKPLTKSMAHTFSEILSTDEDYLMCITDYQLMDVLPHMVVASMMSQIDQLPELCLLMCGIKILSVKTTIPELTEYTSKDVIKFIASYASHSFLESLYGNYSDESEETNSYYAICEFLDSIDITCFYFNPFLATEKSGEVTINAMIIADYVADVTRYIRMRSEHMILHSKCDYKMADLTKFKDEHPDLFEHIKKPDKE